MSNTDFQALVTIDSLELSSVVGGEDPGTGIFANGAGPNRFNASGQLKGSGYGITLEGQGQVQVARSNYGACLDAATTPQERKECADRFATPEPTR